MTYGIQNKETLAVANPFPRPLLFYPKMMIWPSAWRNCGARFFTEDPI